MGKISLSVNIKIVDTPMEAPNYPDSVQLLEMKECIIVGKGTVKGNPTVGIQLTDKAGNKYVVMTTGGLIQMISDAVVGTQQRLSAEPPPKAH
jgi:hypothetical protein